MNAVPKASPATQPQAKPVDTPRDDFAEIMKREIFQFTQSERSIILETCCGGATQQEADQLVRIAEARGLNPLAGECYFVKRWDSARGHKVWAVQTSIDAMRMKAEESGLYDGQDETEFEYTAEKKLVLARVRIYRKGVGRPFVGIARWREFVQLKEDGTPNAFWARMSHNMLAKCAEAQAIRRAFPRRFAGVYTAEEIADERPDAEADERPRAKSVADRIRANAAGVSDEPEIDPTIDGPQMEAVADPTSR
jgi:phage recombination protein Bet